MGQGPEAIASSCMVHYNDTLYVLGGVTKTRVNTNLYKYSIANATWETVSCLGSYKPRSLAGAGVFEGYLYFFYGWSDLENKIETQVVRTNLETDCVWEEVEVDDISYAAQAYAFTAHEDKFYMFGGRSETDIENRIVELTPGKTLISKLIVSSFTAPNDVINGSLEYMSGALYLFGGSYGEIMLNNLWKYDLFKLTWSNLKYYGNFPSPRSHHASASEGDIMVIWGGKNSDNYFNDGYTLNINTLTWSKIISGDLTPSARSSCCITMKLPLIYIYGGVRQGAYTKNIWTYDIRTMEYSEGPRNNNGIEGSGQKCLMGKKGDEDVIYVIFGMAQGDEPIGLVQSYNPNTELWSIEYTPNNSTYDRSGAAITIINDKIYIVGGHTWGYLAYKDILLIDLTNYTMNLLGQISIRTYLTAHAYVANNLYAFGGGAVFDFIIRFDVATNKFFSINFFDICGDDCSKICSPGTYQDNLTCHFCDYGQYSDYYGATECILCPEGSFNWKKGATSRRQCFPCPEGQYADAPGSMYCKDCFSGFRCPVGSIKSFNYTIESSLLSLQPEIFKRNTKYASDMAFKAQISIFFVGLIILIILVSITRLRSHLRDFDLYSNLHNFQLNYPLYKKKNLYGTVFSLLFVVLAFVIIAQSLIIYYEDNIAEIKSLVPLVILEKEVDIFQGNYTIEIALLNYGGECAYNGTCAYVDYSFYSLGYEQYSLNCSLEGQDCILEFICTNCNLESNAIISLKLAELYSYTSAIQVNFTSSSSIPNKISSIAMKIFPQENTVFRGYEPTVFTFTLTPSLYRSKVSGEEETQTGYHVSSDSLPLAGTYYEPTDLGFTADLYVDIELKRSISGLYTERYEIQSTFALLMTLLGSIPGIMSLMGVLMALIEGTIFNFAAKQTHRHNLSKLKTDRKVNRSNFHDEFYNNKNVLPTEDPSPIQNLNEVDLSFA